MCKGSAEFVNGARRETCVAWRGVTECADMRSLMSEKSHVQGEEVGYESAMKARPTSRRRRPWWFVCG